MGDLSDMLMRKLKQSEDEAVQKYRRINELHNASSNLNNAYEEEKTKLDDMRKELEKSKLEKLKKRIEKSEVRIAKRSFIRVMRMRKEEFKKNKRMRVQLLKTISQSLDRDTHTELLDSVGLVIRPGSDAEGRTVPNILQSIEDDIRGLNERILKTEEAILHREELQKGIESAEKTLQISRSVKAGLEKETNDLMLKIDESSAENNFDLEKDIKDLQQEISSLKDDDEDPDQDSFLPEEFLETEEESSGSNHDLRMDDFNAPEEEQGEAYENYFPSPEEEGEDVEDHQPSDEEESTSRMDDVNTVTVTTSSVEESTSCVERSYQQVTADTSKSSRFTFSFRRPDTK